MHVQWKTTWVKTAWRPRRSTNGGTILVGSTNSVLPPHVPASHLMSSTPHPQPSRCTREASEPRLTCPRLSGHPLDERCLRSSVMIVRRTMSACGDFLNKAVQWSGERVRVQLPDSCSNPKPLHSHPRDRHSSRIRVPPVSAQVGYLNRLRVIVILCRTPLEGRRRKSRRPPGRGNDHFRLHVVEGGTRGTRGGVGVGPARAGQYRPSGCVRPDRHHPQPDPSNGM